MGSPYKPNVKRANTTMNRHSSAASSSSGSNLSRSSSLHGGARGSVGGTPLQGTPPASDGLQAILRDHPELISSSLMAAATATWGHPTVPQTPKTASSQHGINLGSAGGSAMCTETMAVAQRCPHGSCDHCRRDAGAKPDYSEAKIVVAMVGLPARGKSYLANKLMRYLKVSWGGTQGDPDSPAVAHTI